MKQLFATSILLIFANLTLFGQQKKYQQPLANDICTKIIVSNFSCKGCAASDKDLAGDIQDDIIETLNKFKYCRLLSRENLSKIIQTGDEETSIASLNTEQRTQIKDFYQADRILFGNLKIQPTGSVLVTLEIDNLTTADQEAFKRFTIPADKFSNYETRNPIVEQEIVSMLLGGDVRENELPKIPQNGLVAYYPFNGNANDESGNNNHGTVTGATLTVDRFNIPNSAFKFNGISDYITVPNSSSISPVNFTVSLWAVLPKLSANNYLRLISKHLDQGGSYGSYQILLGTTDHPTQCLGTAISTTGYFVSESNSSTTPGWHNLVLTWDGQFLKLYLDQALVQQEAVSGKVKYDANPLYIGRDGFYPNSYFQGTIDDIRIYNRALSFDEVSSLFQEKNNH